MSNAISVFKRDQAAHILPMLSKTGFQARKKGIVDYLAKRGFLVKEGSNEYRQFRLQFGRQHYRTDRLELFLLSSEDCNFRCKYCYEDFARGTMRPEIRRGIKRMLEQRIEYLNSLSVSWFGGEPLYGWEAIEELGPFFVELAEKHEIPYTGSMTTNGFLLTPDRVDKLFAWKINSFQITIDGVPETHDCNRPTRDGQGTFATIFENLKSMARREDHFHVTVRVNFDPSNAGRLEEFLDILQKEFSGDDRFELRFHAVGRWGGNNDENLEICGADESRALMSQLKALAHARGLRFKTLKSLNFLGGQVCYAARPFNFVIGADGQIMKCTVALDKADHNIVGHITEEGEMVMDNERLALWTEPAFERDSQCQKCVVLPSCQGISCPLPRIESETRPCVSTRTNAKQELLEIFKYDLAEGRQKKVAPTGNGAPAQG